MTLIIFNEAGVSSILLLPLNSLRFKCTSRCPISTSAKKPNSLFPRFHRAPSALRAFHVFFFFFLFCSQKGFPFLLQRTVPASTDWNAWIAVCSLPDFPKSQAWPFLSRLLPEPPSSSLPVLHLPSRPARFQMHRSLQEPADRLPAAAWS